MKIKGYARCVIHPTEEKGIILEFRGNSLAFHIYLEEFVQSELDDLLSYEEIIEKNPNAKGTLVLVTFDYQGFETFNGEYTEHDSTARVGDVLILDENYREQWRQNLTDLYGTQSIEELKENEGMEDIWEWEEFYGETFIFAKKPHEIEVIQVFEDELDD
ncbi:hypothetical protein [Aneurinibacillus tyrosinisolvens]|uniref:hypothetical protein n=1 Tax=Aneurinibacillus tyrosinisolvens TaxID=1443435 RepID=UPI00063F4523|nr:hypothetical protein [Aneurinibacillus tyrosinisolvens]